MDSFWKQLFTIDWGGWTAKVVATVVLALLAAAGTWLLTRYIKLSSYARRLRRAESAVGPKSRGVWLPSLIQPNPPRDYDRWLRTSIPIWIVANLKGGVGKTTTAANLFAHFAQTKQSALFIDLDFQGSGTSMVLGEDEYERFVKDLAGGKDSKAAQLIEGQTGEWLCSVAQSIAEVPGGRIIPIPLAQVVL